MLVYRECRSPVRSALPGEAPGPGAGAYPGVTQVAWAMATPFPRDTGLCGGRRPGVPWGGAGSTGVPRPGHDARAGVGSSPDGMWRGAAGTPKGHLHGHKPRASS